LKYNRPLGTYPFLNSYETTVWLASVRTDITVASTVYLELDCMVTRRETMKFERGCW